MHYSVVTSIPEEFDQTEASYYLEDELAPYDCGTLDSDYLEFEDLTDTITDEYEQGSPVVIFPNGTILMEYDSAFSQRFIVKDGLVYQKKYGHSKTEKRTKKAKKIRYIPNYPNKKRYKTLSDFAIKCHGVDYYPEEVAFGYYYNPDGEFDWYQIGGRWASYFLVKQDCTEYIAPEKSWATADRLAPKGYKWVCGARKKDIQWSAMYRQEMKDLYTAFRREIKNNAQNGTFRDYLLRIQLPIQSKYLAALPFAMLNHESEWLTVEQMPNGKSEDGDAVENQWLGAVTEYYDSVSNNGWIVIVDCHI